MTAQLSVGMDECILEGPEKWRTRRQPASPIAPLSRGKLGKNKNAAPRRPYLSRGPHRTRALSHLEPRRPVGRGEGCRGGKKRCCGAHGPPHCAR